MEGYQMATKHKATKKGRKLASSKSLGKMRTLRGSGGGEFTITKPIDKPTP
jgi:hypothetical protein